MLRETFIITLKIIELICKICIAAGVLMMICAFVLFIFCEISYFLDTREIRKYRRRKKK